MMAFKHLLRAYGPVYLWFWGIMLLFLGGIASGFATIGNYTLDDAKISVWSVVGEQGPRWFMLVMGIIWVTMSMPLLVANGITRREIYRGGMFFSAFTAVAFTSIIMLGFGVEYAVYHDRGILHTLNQTYPILTAGEAVKYTGITLLTLTGFVVAGWIFGLLFYRFRWWIAILLTPLGAAPLAVDSLRYRGSTPVEATISMAVVIVAMGVLYLLLRGVPIRPKKA